MKFFLLISLLGSIEACDVSPPPELLTGCGAFDSLAVVNPSTGFLVAEETCGLEVDKTTFYEQPFVFYTEALDYMKYTLVMVDNDNPLTADGSLFLQWLATDIDGSSLKHGLGIYEGNTVAGKPCRFYSSQQFQSFLLSAYIPPDPSQETCVHRYSIYLYEQRFHPLDFPELPAHREDFDLRYLIENVIPEGGLCGPVASIEFKSRY